MIIETIKAFFAIFAVMDALGNAPIFISLTEKMSIKDHKMIANKSAMVAAVLLFIFLFFGNAIMDFFGISIGSFKIAGGILLFIIGIKMIFGLSFLEKHVSKYTLAIVPLATPLITGPGVITATIIAVHEYGYAATVIAAAANLIISWLSYRESHFINRILGRQGGEVLSRVMGIILAALAVEFVFGGITMLVKAAV
ncbi:MAG TPA: MarC family protein [Nanoarchaeota archaeon]|nr:MarC family protein [Nanoarchaeota archaeon]